jgi:hypothetical protein
MLSTAALLVFTAAAGAAELPLTRVILSNSGLAQFIHAGSVTGDTVVQLPVRLDQVDDLLKSLTVFDKEGAIGAASLPGKTPLPELFRDLPFGPEALNSSADLLNALIGTEVEITGQVNAKGRVFRVQREQVTLPNNGGTVTRNRLMLMTPNGMTQAMLEDVQELRFTDPQTRAQIERLLAGLTENRAKDRRVLSLGFRGAGTRDVALSYVVAAPVWKTAYRLVLPKDGSKARLQGWAVVENLTGGDWKDVDLVLTSGNPVSLRQPLYTALFANRPEVPVSTGTRVVPRVDDLKDRPAPPAPVAAAPAAAGRQLEAALRQKRMTRALSVDSDREDAAKPDIPASVADAAQAEEGSTQLLYRFPSKVSLVTGHTMMVPFIDREVPVTRIWLYQPDIVATRPLAAVRLVNDGDSGLPAGLVTAFDVATDNSTNFIGDALLPLVPRQAPRLLTFALDTKTQIRRDDRDVVKTTLGKAANGSLTVQTRSKRTIEYEVTAPPDEDREILVEEERIEGWKPAIDQKVEEETPTRFRHKIVARKGATTKASFVLERLDSETVVLTDQDADDMLTTLQGLQNESPRLKDVVARLSAIVQDINKTKTQREQLGTEREKIVADQARIRSNLQSVGQASDLGRRYIDTLKSQEDRLAAIAKSDAELEKQINAKEAAAEEVAKQLTL